MRHLIRKASAFLLCASLLWTQIVLPARAETTDKTDKTLQTVILGDSIAKAYSADKSMKLTSYGTLVSETVAEEHGTSFLARNYAKNGYDASELNEKILSKAHILGQLRRADMVFISLGSNDLLNEFKTVAQEILKSDTKFKSANQALSELQAGVKENPLLILSVINELSTWDYTGFEREWVKAMDTITSETPEDVTIVVNNIYNPVSNLELPGTINKVVEDIIENMNDIIKKRASEYGYTVVNLFDSDIGAFVQDDGLHPDQDGQQLIADMIYKRLEKLEQQEKQGNTEENEDAEKSS